MKASTAAFRQRWARFVLESQSASGFGLALVLTMGILGYTQAVPNWAPVSIVLLVIGYEFQRRMDQGVPLLQLTSLLAVLQWLLGPLLCYSADYEYFHGRYSMYVPEDVYFRFAIPATCGYVALMLVFGVSIRQGNMFQHVRRKNFATIGFLLNCIGLGAAVAAGEGLGTVAFLFHLLSQLRYVGALYFLFSGHPLRLLFVGLSCLPLLTNSLGSGMFHDLILWAAIIFCFWFAQRKWQAAIKIAVLTCVAFGLFSVQVVKQDYRKQLREGKTPSLPGLMYEYVTPGGKAWGEQSLSMVITRLNQGWIISAVMNHVPEAQPFAEGQTVIDAVVNAALPRVIFRNKKTAGGRDNFRQYTGLDIQNSTSMGISPLGEAYANFGVNGGILFMLAFGSAFAVLYRVMLRYTLRYPTFIFWLPLIFYQAIKAETELLVVINQLVKGSVIAFGGHYLLTSMVPGQKKLLATPPRSAART